MEQEQKEIEIFFCHLRSKFGAITVAYKERPGDLYQRHRIEAGFSFCRNDNFSRSLGREIAKGRLEKNPVKITKICINDHGKLQISETIISFFDQLILCNSSTNPKQYIETALHIKPWANSTKPKKHQGNFLIWFYEFTGKLKFEHDKNLP